LKSPLSRRAATFVEPMECALVSKLPEGPAWTYEVKLDGYRGIGVKTGRETILYSRNGKNFNKRFPQIVEALRDLPADTVIDGEVVALDYFGRPNFHGLQHFTVEAQRIHYFVFDLLGLKGRDLTGLPLSKRRELMSSIKFRSPRIRLSEQFNIPADKMLAAVREQQLEGVIGKRNDSLYEPGKRSGAWVKMRINKRQELVIGGFMPGPHGIDSIIVGYYRGKGFVLCRPCAKWICASESQDGLREVEASCQRQMPVRQSARDRTRQMGRDFRRREDEEMRLGAP
jgi:ATP-dependent DNA ligase